MSDLQGFEARLAESLRTYAAPAARPPRREAVAMAVAAAREARRGVLGGLRWPTLQRLSMAVAAGASAVVLVVAGAVGLNFFVNQQGIGAPPPNPSSTPSMEPSVDLGIFEPIAGRIVYETQTGIWAVDPASSDPTTTVQLTSGSRTPLGWSSDGTRLLIQKGNENLFILHADGSETQVTDQLSGFNDIGGPARPSGATISPDGSRVAFAGLTKPWVEELSCQDGALFAVDADGGPAEVLWESQNHGTNGIVRDPTFSPDGTQIAFVDGYCDSGHSVWVMNADGTDAHQIVSSETSPPGGGHVHGLAWSASGDRIALAESGDIYTFAPDGSNFTRIAGSGTTCDSIQNVCGPLHYLSEIAAPYWSPDGSQIAYTTGCVEGLPFVPGGEGCMLVIADADGSNPREFGFARSGPWHPGTPSPAVEPTTAPSPSMSPAAPPDSMWPQSTRAEVQAAQELADAGDPSYIWQVDPDLEAHLAQGGPYREEIFARFLREKLGWERFRWTLGNGAYEGEVVFLRCAPGPTNPLYPNDPTYGLDCDPTIDESRYETVQINVAQLDRQGPSGIWVVIGWEMLEPFEQIAPPSDASALAYGVDGDVFLADADGSNAVRIADGVRISTAEDCAPGDERADYMAFGRAWSPDGQYLAYWDRGCPWLVRDAEDDPWGIVRITDAAGNLVASFPGQGWMISWSPDSTRVAVMEVWGGPGDRTIGVYAVTGIRQAALTVPSALKETGVGDYSPVWSRDGSSILVRNVQVPLDGGAPTLFPEVRPYGAYSPDGSRYAYVGRGSLVVEDADEPDATKVSGALNEYSSAAWSPNGDLVAFEGDGTELLVRNVATGGDTSLLDVTLSERVSVIEFSPDGDRIVFTRSDAEGDSIGGIILSNISLWSIGTDGSDLRRLVDGIEWADLRPQGR